MSLLSSGAVLPKLGGNWAYIGTTNYGTDTLTAVRVWCVQDHTRQFFFFFGISMRTTTNTASRAVLSASTQYDY